MQRKILTIVLIFLFLTAIPALAAGLAGLADGAAAQDSGSYAPTLRGAPAPAALRLAPAASTWNLAAAPSTAATPFINVSGFPTPATDALAE